MTTDKTKRKTDIDKVKRKPKSSKYPLLTNINIWLTAKDAIDNINCISWAPTGSILALGGKGKIIRLWDTITKRTHKIFEGASSVIKSIAWSPDGRLLAASGDSGFVRVWNVKTGVLLNTPDVHQNTIYSVSFSPNGKIIASAGYDKTIRLWSVQTGQLLQVLHGHEDWIYSLSWALNSSTLASGAGDGAIRLWNVERGRLIEKLKFTNSPIYSLAWSPTLLLLASGSGDGVTRIWDADTEEVCHTFRQQGAVRSVAWSPKNKTIIAAGSGNGTIKLWSTETNQILQNIINKRFDLKSIGWSPDGRLLASGGDDGTVRLWDTERKELQHDAKSHNQLSTMAFSPNGRTFAVGLDSNTLQIRDSETDAVIQVLSETAIIISSLCWSVDGCLLALGSNDGTVKICSASTGNILSVFDVSENSIAKLALATDRTTLASVAGGVVFILNIGTGNIQKIYRAQGSSKTIDISFSPDGNFLALNEENRTIRIWNKQTGSIIPLDRDSSSIFVSGSSYINAIDFGLFDDVHQYRHTPLDLGPRRTSLFDDNIPSLSSPLLDLPFFPPLNATIFKPLEDLLKITHSDLPDLNLLIEEARLTVPKLYDAVNNKLGSLLGFQVRSPTSAKSSAWFKGGKKVDKKHYVSPKETNSPITTLPRAQLLDPLDIFESNIRSSRLGRKFSSLTDMYSHLESAYGWMSGFSRISHYTQLDLGGDIWVPIMDVEGYYYRLKQKYKGASRKDNSRQNKTHSLVWSPDGTLLAVGSSDGIINIWDVKAIRLSNKLEGHNGTILDLIWSEDGRVLASYSTDQSIRLWRCDNWVPIKIIQTPNFNDVSFGVSFHKTLPTLSTLVSGDAVVYGWEFDVAALLSSRLDTASVHYTSAKIVLVGESNVGKSCLALRLAEDRYFEQGTTHGMRMWPINPEKLDPVSASSEEEKRDVILWDMGGQDEYRLVHQLFLHDTTVALILLDPTRGRTAFNEVEGWNLRLEKQVGGRQAIKLLVGTKMDAKSSVIDRAGLERLVSTCNFTGFYPTSAKTKKGIGKLRKAIAAAINWDVLVRTSRPILFQIVRDEIDRRQKKGEIVLLYSDLEERIKKLAPDQFDQKSINSVVEQLALQGIVAGTRLASGERVLVLQVSEIERYAGSIIIAARNNPRGVPALEEQMIASSRMVFPGINEKERLHKFQERIVLECVVQLLLEHGICLKHEGLLIFPSLFEPTEIEESIETHHSVSLYYDFSGAIDNIYSALIARLAISEQFGRVRLWENRAEFDKAGEGICGLRKVDHRSGLAHLDLFFSEYISRSVRDLFTVFVEEHLRKEGVNITEVIEVTCSCGYRFQESSLRKRLAQGQGDIICPECEERNRISEGAQQVRSNNTEVEDQLLALKTIILEKSREAVISAKVTFMESADHQSRTLPIRILHLSDLHMNADDDSRSLAQPLIRDLDDPRGGLGFEQLDYLVITGDLTNRATPQEFEKAHQFISTLIDRFKLTAERCIIVPGNHDLSWETSVYDWKQHRLLNNEGLKAGSYVKQGEIFLVRNDETYPSRFANFARFYHSLTQQEYSLRTEEQCIPILFEDTLIQFLTMNSAWEIDEFFPERSGINEHALSSGLERADEQIRKARKEGRLTTDAVPLRIATIHHPVMGNEQISDNTFLERLQQEDFHLCLHGHVHEERVGIVGPPDPIRNIHIIGAGSVGAPMHARPESVPRLYNVIEVAPTRDRVRVHTRSMSKKGGAWRGWAIWPADTPTERRTYYDIKLSNW